jgi:hypothetical protein
MRTPEADRLVGYMPIVVRSGGISKDDRKFAASVIARDRKGSFVPSAKQEAWMRRLVDRLQAHTLGEVTE